MTDSQTHRKKSSQMMTSTLIGLLTIGLALNACAPTKENQGNLIQDHQIERLTSSKHTKQTVLRILGSPTTRAPFDDNTWYYISQQTEKTGIYHPEIINQKIISVTFDPEGYLEKVAEIKGDVTKDLPIVDAKTPTAGTETNAIKQFLGNLGRFNQPLGGIRDDDIGVGGPGLPNP